MNIYKKLSKYLPEFIVDDLFLRKDSADNSLTMYAAEKDANKRLIYSDYFFREGHRFLKAITLFINFIDRQLARTQIYYIRQKAKHNQLFRKNKIFKNKHKGERCFILGQGPSLAKQDLRPLAKEITFATNTFWKHPIISDKWQPTYYSATHFDAFYGQGDDRPGNDRPSVNELLNYYKNARSKITDAQYFVNFSGYLANKKYKFFPDEEIYVYQMFPYSIFEFLPEWPDLSVGIPWALDSSQYCIMMAMYMGCKQIILLGCDHDWYVNLGEEKRFFTGGSFDNGKNQDFSKIAMTENMWYAWVLWRGHENLKRLADKHGVQIINATGGGVLDVYPIAKYEDLVSK